MTKAKRLPKHRDLPNVAIPSFTAVMATAMMTVSAYATNLGTKLKGIFQSCYADVTAVFDIAAILALGVCLVTLLFGRGSKSAEKSYDWMKTIIGCFIVFHFLGTLVPWLSGLFEGTGGVALNTITGFIAPII